MVGLTALRPGGVLVQLRNLLTGQGFGLTLARTATITATGFILAQGLKLASNLITTRFLADQPEAFALMGVALVINTFVVMLTDVGIQSSIIRSDRGDDARFLRTAWVTAIVRNAILFVLVMGIAGGVFLGQSAGVFRPGSTLALAQLPAVIAAIATTLLFAGFASANLALARRHMRAVRVTAFEIGIQLIGSGVTIALCAVGLGVWALVAGTLVGAAATTALSHVVMPGPRMAFAWNRGDFAELFTFGKWLLLASACGFVVNQADKLIFGYFLDADRLSLYVIASIWVGAVITLFSKVSQMALYPALSRAYRESDGAVVSTYRRVRLVVDGLCGAGFIALMIVNEPLFVFLYEPPFEEASRYFAILILSVLLLPYRLLNILLLSSGHSRRFSAVTGVGAVYTLIAVPLAFVWGGETVAIAAFVARDLLTMGATLVLARNMVPFSVLREGRMLAAFLLASAYILMQS